MKSEDNACSDQIVFEYFDKRLDLHLIEVDLEILLYKIELLSCIYDSYRMLDLKT